MAILNNIINLVVCGLDAVLGTGTKGCRPELKKTQELWFVPKGFVFNGAAALNTTYAEQLQAEGKLVVVKKIQGFTDNSSDDQIETLENGVKRVTTLGLYEFMVDFVNGIYFHAALTSLNSFGSYDVLFVDTEGNIFGTKAANGSLKGFSVGTLQGGKLKFATDTEGQRESLMFQLTNRPEVDENYVFIQKQADFDPRTLEGVNQVNLEYVNAPAVGDTTLTVKASLTQNGEAVSGLAFGDFSVKKDGVTANPTAGDDSVTAGTYVLTVTALTAGAIATSLYDNANSRIGVILDGVLYKSGTISATVA